MKIKLKKQKSETFERRRSDSQASPKVFSYYARGSSSSSQNTGRQEQQLTTKNPRSYKRLIYLPSYIALFIILVTGIYACWLQPSPKIVILNREGTLLRSDLDYQTGISSLWQRSIFNQTKLTIHSAIIKNDILSQYSELSNVQIELPLLGRRPTVLLTPTKPAFKLVASNGVFYISSVGKVMAKANEVTENQLGKVPLVRDETGIPAETSKNVVPESEAKYLASLSAQLEAESIQLESITLPSTAANEADVRVTGQAYYIKFSTIGNPRQAVGAYQTVKAKLEADSVTPKEYIDVRVDEKVFYK